MATGQYDERIVGVWDKVYPKDYDPESVRVIIREEIDLALRSPDISQLLIDGTVPTSKLRFSSGETLPLAAADGNILVYEGSGFSWLLKYHRTSGYWHFIGGPPIIAEVDTSESTSSATYVDLATVGPTVVVPFSGDYLVEYQARTQGTGAAAIVSFSNGATAASDNDALVSSISTESQDMTLWKWAVVTVAGGDSITMKYRTSGVAVSFLFRGLRVTPIRVRRV